MKRLILILLLTACAQTKSDPNKYIISGVIEGGNYNDYIYLNYGEFKDSVIVKNDRFEFKGSVDQPIPSRIHVKSPSTFINFYLENGRLKLHVEYEKSQLNSGEPLNILSLDSIHGSHAALLEMRYDEFLQKNSASENFNELLYEELSDMLSKNPNHPYSGKILAELTTVNSVLSYERLERLFQLVDTTFQHQEDLNKIKTGFNNLINHNIGSAFPAMNLPNPDSVNTKLTDLLGKTMLVDFWASWCGPCRIKHPQLVTLYNKYQDKNFDILSVSIDQDRKKWIDAINDDHLTWNNVWDTDQQIHDKLGIRAIPYNYLIDEHGIIIGINMTIEQIEKILIEKTSG